MKCPYCGYSIHEDTFAPICYQREGGSFTVRQCHPWCRANMTSPGRIARISSRLRKLGYLARVDGYYPPKISGAFLRKHGLTDADVRGRYRELSALPGAF